MSKICETVVVNCPFGQAPGYLRYYFEQLAGKDGKTVIALDVPLSDLHIPGEMVMSRKAIFNLAEIPDPQHLRYATAVTWSPEGGGPYPKFNGFILIEADENYGMSRLTLEGEYEPPFGAAGKLFDVAVGRSIARATVRGLLDVLRGALEQWRQELYARATIPG